MRRFELEGKIYEVSDDISDEEFFETLETPKKTGVVEALGQSVSAAAESIPASVLNVGRAIPDLAGQATRKIGDVLGIENTFDPFTPVADRIGEAAEGYSTRAKQKRPDVSEYSPLVQGVLNAPESLTTNAASIAGAVMTGGAPRQIANKAIGLMGASVAGTEYGEAKEAGLSPAMAALYGTGQGMTEAVFESMPMGKLFSDLDKNVGLRKMLLAQMAREIPTEQATTVFQDANQWAMLNPDKTFNEFLAERPNAALQTLGATVAQTGVMTTGAYGINSLANRAQKEQNVAFEKAKTEIAMMGEEAFSKLQAELDAQAGAIDMTETFPNNHTIDDTPTKLPKAIPMYLDENGEYRNTPIENVEPELVPVAGDEIFIANGSIKENVEAGEIALNAELKAELEASTFSNPDEAIKTAAMLQMKIDNVAMIHQVDELGNTKAINLVAIPAENLVAKLQELKSETGFPITTKLFEKNEELANATAVTDSTLSRREELVYKMLNPLTPERKAELLAKAERIERNEDIPDAVTPVDVDSLDAIWSAEVEKGTFEPKASEDSGGITDAVIEGRAERYVPEVLPPSLRTIEVSSVKEAEGLTLRKLEKQAGTFGVGGNERSFPREYQEAVVKLAEDVRLKYMGAETTLVINFENFGTDKDIFGNVQLDEAGNPQFSTMGAHFRLGDGTHVITPRELAGWDTNKAGYNKLTVNEAIRSLTHELGHAVWLNEFYRGMDKTIAGLFQNLFALDDLAGIREHLNSLPESQREVVEEWLSLREQVETQSARWFIENWIGVRKLGLGVGRYVNKSSQSIYLWSERELAKRNLNINGASAKDLVHSLFWDEELAKENQQAAEQQAEKYILSFNEYMAEQFTRHAYGVKLEETSLANNAFFQRALNALRNFFRDLKLVSGENAETVIKAGEKFETWVTGLSNAYATIEGKNAVKRTKAKTKRKIVSEEKREENKVEKAPKVKKDKIQAAPPAPELTVLEDTTIVAALTKMIPLVRKEDPYVAEELKTAIAYGQYEEAQQIIQEVLGKKVSFDKTYSFKFMQDLTKGRKNNAYSIEYLTNFAKRPEVRQWEKLAIAELIEFWQETNSTEDVEARWIEIALSARTMPLLYGTSDRYTNNGWGRIGQGTEFARTVLLLGEKTPFLTHFTGSNVIAHYRVNDIYVEGEPVSIPHIIEAQSDVLQKLGSSRLIKHENFTENLKKVNTSLVAENEKLYEKLKIMQKDWNKRILQEISAEETLNLASKIRIAHENTMGLAEGWLRFDGMAGTEWLKENPVVLSLPELENRDVRPFQGFEDFFIRFTGTAVLRDFDGLLGSWEFPAKIYSKSTGQPLLNPITVDPARVRENLTETQLNYLDEVRDAALSRFLAHDFSDDKSLMREDEDIILDDGQHEFGSDIASEFSLESHPDFTIRRAPTFEINGRIRSFEAEVVVNGSVLDTMTLRVENNGRVFGNIPTYFRNDARLELNSFVEMMFDFIDRKAVGKVNINLNGIYKRHKELRELAQKMYGGKLIRDDKNMLWVEYETKPEMQTVSLDSTKPGGRKAQQAIATLSKLKDKSINKSANFVGRATIALQQLQQLAAVHPDILPLKVLNDLQQGYSRLKNQMLVRPQQVVDEWSRLGANQAELLDKLMRKEKELGVHQTELVRSNGFFAHSGGATLDAFLESNGVDLASEDGIKLKNLFIKIKNTHLHQLNVLEAVLRDILWKKFGRNTAVFSEKWNTYKDLFTEMRDTVFLPNMQYGNYVIFVKEQIRSPAGIRTETVFRKHFESKSERDIALVEMRKNATGTQVVYWKDLKDEQSVTLALPYDFIQSIADTRVFSQDQIELMQELIIPTRLEKFEKRWQTFANGIPGGDDNLFRNFAAYTWHNANFVSKLKYNQDMNRTLAAMRSDLREAQALNDLPRERLLNNVLDTMTEVKTYLMHPPAEFEGLRTSISLLYLSFMAKTALMNLTSGIHTIYAAQVEFGEVAGTKAFAESLSLLKSAWGVDNASGGKTYATLEARINNATGKEQDRLKAIKFALDKAVADGVLDQSYAYMLAGMATSGTRMKLYQKYPKSRYGFAALDAGMSGFRVIEKTNRIVSLLTFFQLEYDASGDVNKAYEDASKKTLLLQNDYSRANRIKLMRGKTGARQNPMSLVTIFLSYAQFMGWLTTGGYDRSLKASGVSNTSPVNFTMRLWLTYAMLGGLMGLPFAENIMDILQYIFRKLFNIPNPEYEVRKLIDAHLGHENLIMHGFMHNVNLGIGSVDLSASFGLGRLIPGTEPIATMDEMGAFEFVGKEIGALTGVTGSFFKSLWDAASAESLDDAAKKLPGILGSIGKSVDSYENGIMTQKGVRLNRDAETGEFIKQDEGLAFLQIMGFNPAEASAARKQQQMSYEIVKYYSFKQAMLMLNRNKAILYGDAEAKKSAEIDIAKYNNSIPEEFKSLKITGKVKAQSLKRYKNSITKAEKGLAPTRKQNSVYRAVGEVSDE